MTLAPADTAAVDALFATEFARDRAPGLAYAIVRDGEILHHVGFGTTMLNLDHELRPTVDSIGRIASMSKSFTAAAIQLLVERGQLALDTPAARYVPAFQPMHSADAASITIRHLLTMSAGLLTDDPWGDRNEPQTPAELDAFLVGGFRTGARPGELFEYANLGYAVLGRVVDAVVGADGGFRRFILDEIVDPLGMVSTRYDASAVGPHLAVGYQRRSTGWTPEPLVRPGTFSAMGGLHSSLRDLATWVGGFTDAFRDPSAPHPLSAAKRREMQQVHRYIAMTTTEPQHAAGYGFGLIAEHHADHGHVVQHSGGYPGYGSHMRWHPETGLGVIVLGNGTYCAPVPAAIEALRRIVLAEQARPVPPTYPVPDTSQIVAEVTRRLIAGEDFTDPGIVTFNVPIDVPAEERVRQLAEQRDRVGAFVAPSGPLAPIAHGLGRITWSVAAEHGRYDIEIKIAPTLEPRIQQLTVTGVPDAIA